MKILKKLAITLCTMCLFLYLAYILINQQTKLNELDEEIAYFDKELQKENLQTEILNDTIASMTEDEYIEEVARERLGLIMPTEIIFMDASI